MEMNYEDDLNHGLATLVMGWTLGDDPRASRYMGEDCPGTMIRLLPGEVRPENSWDLRDDVESYREVSSVWVVV